MRQIVTVSVLLVSLVAVAIAGAATPAHAAAPSATAGTQVAAAAAQPGHGSSRADRQRGAAIRQYRKDLVSVVALRADPSFLLGAAILSRSLQEPIPELGFAALSARATSAPGAGLATHWARLADCQGGADCRNSQALTFLKQHAAGNAAVWLVALDVAAAGHDAKGVKAALAEAAAAQTYDDYYGSTLAGVANAVGALPPLPETMNGAHDGQPDNPDGVRVLVAVNSTRTLPRPDFGPLLRLCGSGTSDKTACLDLARTLQAGGSPVARAAGLRIQGDLDPALKSRTQQAVRDLAWQRVQYFRLLQQALVDRRLASGWLARAREGDTELNLMLGTLRANQVPTRAPAGAEVGSTHDSSD